MTSDLSRRHLLVLAVGAASAAGGLGCAGGSGGSPELFGDVTAGNVSALQLNTITPIAGAPAFVGRDAAGLYAMTTTCSHEGCDLKGGNAAAGTITCRCHHSQFNLTGAVLQGPAQSPLTHFAVEVADDGTITVHGETVVDPSTRTPIG